MFYDVPESSLYYLKERLSKFNHENGECFKHAIYTALLHQDFIDSLIGDFGITKHTIRNYYDARLIKASLKMQTKIVNHLITLIDNELDNRLIG